MSFHKMKAAIGSGNVNRLIKQIASGNTKYGNPVLDPVNKVVYYYYE